MPPHAGGSVSSHHVGGFGGDGPPPRSGLLRARRVQRRRVAAVGDYRSDDTHWDLSRQPHICRGERGEVQAAGEPDADSERVCVAGEVDTDGAAPELDSRHLITQRPSENASFNIAVPAGTLLAHPTSFRCKDSKLVRESWLLDIRRTHSTLRPL